MESMVLGNGEVKTEETEDDSNMYGADFEYKNVKVELDDAAIKAELTEDDMCSADFDYKDVKVEFHGGEVKAEITDVCSANFDYKDIKFEPDNETVKAETTDDYSNMRSADLENKDFQLGHAELHIKDDGGTSSEALESMGQRYRRKLISIMQ
ncbi:unnamed protein product [Acanthoscelides obtectus]|uniref:Uncharacterized protein n=1 Tax=Acanthoscelides obtectus TaxID=200917 RepID=A0A9P0LF70_ACAOB|nr:unnamed protein product [Acanthoscelides obtectus]CAK1620004.1 hypothetical protein AOBTE_LOCUS128 [Acanthoscelides obtectus]